MNRFGYTYLIVRYMHDVVSGECLNVAVMLQSSDGSLQYRIPASLSRVEAAFPEADIDSIRNALDAVGKNVKQYFSARPEASLSDAVSAVLAEDESSIRAGKLGAGMTSDLSAAANDLLERFILCCERQFDDVDVTENRQEKVAWRPAVLRNMQSNNDNDWEAVEPRVASRA